MATSAARKPRAESYIPADDPLVSRDDITTAPEYIDPRIPTSPEPAFGVAPALVILGIIILLGLVLAMTFGASDTSVQPVTNSVTQPAQQPALPSVTDQTQLLPGAPASEAAPQPSTPPVAPAQPGTAQ